LKILAGMKVSGRIDRSLRERGGFADGRAGDLIADKRTGGFGRYDGTIAGAAISQTAMCTSAVFADRDDCRHSHQSEISPAPRDLHKAGARAGQRRRKLDFDQHLLRAQIGRQWTLKKVIGRYPAFAAGRLCPHAAAQSQDDGGQFRGWIGIGQIAANRAAVANLRMRHMRHGFVQQRLASGDLFVPLRGPVPRQCADAKHTAGIEADRVEFGDPVDIDQHAGLDQAKIHHRNEALSAGKEVRLVAMFGFQRKRMVKAASRDIDKGRRFHRAQSFEGLRAILASDGRHKQGAYVDTAIGNSDCHAGGKTQSSGTPVSTGDGRRGEWKRTPSLEFRQIRYALSVAKERSFTRAATKLNISQSAVSEQIKLLEEQIGFALFNRTPRGVELTDRGRTFIYDAERVVGEVLSLSDTAQRLRGAPTHTLTVGMGSGMAQILMPRIFGKEPELLPGVRLVISTAPTRNLLNDLHEERVDAAIVIASDPDRVPAGLTFHPLAEAEMALIIHPKHKLAKTSQPVDVRVLAAEPIIMNELTMGYGQIVESLFSELGIRPNILAIADNVETIKTIVQSGKGIAIVPRACAASEIALGTLKAVSIRPRCSVVLSMFRRRQPLSRRQEANLSRLLDALKT